MKIESLTIVGASANPEKFGHLALKKALESNVKVYAVNTARRRIDVYFDDGKQWNVPTFRDVMGTPEVTDFVVAYVPRETWLKGGLAEQIVERRFPNIIVPPTKVIDSKTTEEGMEIRRYLQKKGYDDNHLFIDTCYLRDF